MQLRRRLGPLLGLLLGPLDVRPLDEARLGVNPARRSLGARGGEARRLPSTTLVRAHHVSELQLRHLELPGSGELEPVGGGVGGIGDGTLVRASGLSGHKRLGRGEAAGPANNLALHALVGGVLGLAKSDLSAS